MLDPNEQGQRQHKVSIAPTGTSGGKGGASVAASPSGRHQSIDTSGQDNRSRHQSVAASNAPARPKSISAPKDGGVSGRSNQPPKLPKCPEGQTMTPSGVPCERRTKGRQQPRRKTGFRVPLKKEDGNMEAQVIEYNCEFPNRVVVRLEYLMQTTKVRLNDRNYMDDFYEKLMEEERIVLARSTRHRERAEENRMKKLIIDGVNKDIPPELSYLHKHPVFRVNQMLGRLQNYDSHLALQPTDFEDELTPVEPYEYNGNKFFKHLHDTGELWVPSTQRLYDEDKLEGKIYRAKLRLLQKRKEEAAEEKILRIMNNIQSQREDQEDEPVGGEEGDVRPARPSWLIAIEKNRIEEDHENARLNKALKMEISTTQPFSAVDMAVNKIKATTHKDVTRINEKIRRSKEREREQEALLELKRHEQETNFVDTFNYDKARIVKNYDNRQKNRLVDDLLDRPDQKSRKAEKLEASGGAPLRKPKPYERLFEGPTETEQAAIGRSQFSKEPLFNKLQRVYGVKPTFPFHHFESFDNELILDYLDRAEDGKEMMDFGEDISDMYTRELMVADDHVKSRQKAMEQMKEKLKQ